MDRAAELHLLGSWNPLCSISHQRDDLYWYKFEFEQGDSDSYSRMGDSENEIVEGSLLIFDILSPRGCAVMSLRRNEMTEVISQCGENKEIATPACRNAYLQEAFRLIQALRRAGTLLSVARKDEREL